MTLEIEAQPLPPFLLNHQNRLSSTCDRHPDENVTGFCASCLRERLAGLDHVTPRRKSTSALKSIFFRGGGAQHPAASSSSSFLPELRRCKSFSGGRGDGFSGPSAAFEPQRKSCDVRARNTLWSLFHLDDKGNDRVGDAIGVGEIEIECRNLGFQPCVADPVPESREEEEEEEEERDDDDDEIRTVDPVIETTGEIGGGEEEEVELKPMKDHIDLDSQTKKPPPKDLKEIAGSFWLAASVFSKKLQKWRRKQKLKKNDNKAASAMQAKKPSTSRRFRDTQSEIAVDAFGRRSCDTDPRFSLDAGRISFDDPRYSWDEPRASWDGYLIGGRSVFPRLPPMVSVVEDVPVPAVQRSDGQIPVEEDSLTPGGSVQTRDYYLDSSSQRRRRSLDRSSSLRKPTVDVDEPKPVSNAKVSPAGGTEFFHALHGSKLEGNLRDLSSNSLRDDCSESFESAFRDPWKGNSGKKSKRWSKAWNIWGFIHRRSSSRGGGANVVERSFSESWPELRREGYNGKILRSNSSVSSRNYLNGNAGFGSMRRGSVETNGHGKKREDFGLERNRSARYSPSHIDNGLLRFYLTPMRSSRRNGVAGKNRHNSSHSFTRSVLRLY